MKERIKKVWKKHKKKIIFFIILVVGFIVFKVLNGGGNDAGNIIPANEVIYAEKKDFVNSVRESGTVYSKDTMDLYAEKPLPVKEILVKVGDKVEKGDVIARLDSSAIQKEIDTTKASITDTKKSAQSQIESARVQLQEAEKQNKNGTNPQVLAAIEQADTLKNQWLQAEKTYNDFKNSLEQGYNEALLQIENQKKSLKQALEQATLSYNQALERQRENNENIDNAEDDMEKSKRETDRLRRILEDIDWEMSRLKSQSEIASSGTINISQLENQLNIAKQELENLKNPTNPPDNTTENPQITQKETEIANLINEIEQAKRQQSQAIQAANQSQKLSDLSIEQQRVSTDLQKAEADYQKAKSVIDGKDALILQSEQEVEQLKKSMEIADLNLKNAETSDLSSAKSREDMLETYRMNAEALKKSYDNANKNIATQKEAALSNLRLLRSNYKTASAQGSSNVSEVGLKYLNEDLKKTDIIAPISGTVTKLNLTIGQVPQIAAATIETIDNTIIKSDIKEYDLYRIKAGMKAEITSDALNDTFYAKVREVSPTPIEPAPNAIGQTDVRYEVKLDLRAEDAEKLNPGITVRVEYIIEEKKDALTLPSNAIYDKNGKNFILAIKDKMIEEVPIEIETENDFEAVIKIGKEYENLPIIASPENYSPGMEVVLEEQATDMPTSEPDGNATEGNNGQDTEQSGEKDKEEDNNGEQTEENTEKENADD